MNISHHHTVGNSSKLFAASGTNQSQYKTKSKSRAARLVSISHDHNQSSSESFNSKTITVLISFLKLGKYDDAWLKLGKQLLLLHKSPNKQKFYRSALCCFKSSIKAHPDNPRSILFQRHHIVSSWKVRIGGSYVCLQSS